VLFGIAQYSYLQFNRRRDPLQHHLRIDRVLPLLMVWDLRLLAIILPGAEVAYAHQTLPLYRREVRGTPAGAAARESIGLAIAVELARAFRDGRAPWSVDGPLGSPRHPASDRPGRDRRAGEGGHPGALRR